MLTVFKVYLVDLKENSNPEVAIERAHALVRDDVELSCAFLRTAFGALADQMTEKKKGG